MAVGMNGRYGMYLTPLGRAWASRASIEPFGVRVFLHINSLFPTLEASLQSNSEGNRFKNGVSLYLHPLPLYRCVYVNCRRTQTL